MTDCLSLLDKIMSKIELKKFHISKFKYPFA